MASKERSASDGTLEGGLPQPKAARSRNPSTGLYIAIAGVIAIALALGLGLGLGLKHHHPSPSSGSSSNNSSSLTPITQLVNSTQFTLDPTFQISATATTREYNWTVGLLNGAPLGVAKPMLALNGISPGPLIEANSGDRIIVHVKNGLSDNATAIHWHGLYQYGTSWYDGTNGVTQCGIPPGETLTYNFVLDGNWTGTTWWHAHYSTQYTDGLYGPLVVHSPTETVPKSDGELVVTMTDVYNTFSQVLLADYLADESDEPANEPVADGALINGIGQFSLCSEYPDQECIPSTYFNFTLAANKTYRIRVINTGSFAGIRFSVDSHTLTVIELDGTAVEPVTVAGVSLQVAQRASVLLTTNQTGGAYWMRALLDDSMYTATNPGLNTNQLGVVRYAGIDASTMPDAALAAADPGPGVDGLPDMDDDAALALVPADKMDAPAAKASVKATFSIQKTSDLNWRVFWNETSWAPPPDGQATLFEGLALNATDGSQVFPQSQLMTMFDEEMPVDIIIDNIDDGDHPFHFHGHKVWIMGLGAGQYAGQSLNSTNPMRRDTFLVPAYHWMVVRFNVDHAGYWALHCHISWHMSGGGLMQIVTLPSQLQPASLPQDMVAQCATLAKATKNAGELS